MVRRMLNIALLTAAFLLLAGAAGAQDDPAGFGPKPTGAAKAQAQYKANLAAHKGNADRLVLPGLLADRKARTVEVLAECTGLKAEEAVEFLLVDQASSHGYEALLWSFAKPSDVHCALEFIGLKPGAPYNPAALRFWADGDRVSLAVRKGSEAAFPIERLILDKETEKTLPEEGFVFAGSVKVPPQGGTGDTVYAADVYDPRSVASIYNEPAAVLDVPRQASQGEVYGKQVVNPERALAHGELLTVVMRPRDPAGAAAPRRLVLSIAPVAGATGTVFRLTESDGTKLMESAASAAVVERLVQMRKDNASPFLRLAFADALPVPEVGRVCALMAVLELLGTVRIEPPAADQLYYRAFVPEKSWGDPAERPTQPWELHLVRTNGTVSGKMVLNEPVSSDEGVTPTCKRVTCDVATPKAVRARLDADAAERQAAGKSLPPYVLLVFAAADFSYGETLAFITPALKTHGTVYVFVEK